MLEAFLNNRLYIHITRDDAPRLHELEEKVNRKWASGDCLDSQLTRRYAIVGVNICCERDKIYCTSKEKTNVITLDEFLDERDYAVTEDELLNIFEG